MECDQIEELILDSFDGGLSDDQARFVVEHVAACEGCRAFENAQRALDQQLTVALQPMAIPASVRSNIFRLLDEEAAAARKAIEIAKAEAEYQGGQILLRRSVFARPEHWIDCIAWAAGAIVYGFCLLAIFEFPMQQGWAHQWAIAARPLSILGATLFTVVVSLRLIRSDQLRFSGSIRSG